MLSKHERLDDPQVEAAAEDAAELARELARGEGRLFRVGLYVTVRASTEEALEREAIGFGRSAPRSSSTPGR